MVVVLSIIIGLYVINYFIQWRKKKRLEEKSNPVPKSYTALKKQNPSLSTDDALELLSVEFDSEKPEKTVKPVSLTKDIYSEFEFKIEDVFHISGRGTVVTGTISKGSVKINDKLFLVKSNARLNDGVGQGIKKPVTVKGIEQFRKLVAEAKKDEDVGILLDGVNKEDVERNDFLLSEH